MDQSAKEERSLSLFTSAGLGGLKEGLLTSPSSSSHSQAMYVTSSFSSRLHRHKKVSIESWWQPNYISKEDKRQAGSLSVTWICVFSLSSMKLYSSIHGKENTADVVESVRRLGQSEWNTLCAQSAKAQKFRTHFVPVPLTIQISLTILRAISLGDRTVKLRKKNNTNFSKIWMRNMDISCLLNKTLIVIRPHILV